MNVLRYVVPCLAAGLWADAALAEVNVSFLQPDRYVDIGGSYGVDAEHAMNEIAGYLKQLGERDLVPGLTLKIEVLDVDLAGRIEWGRRYDVRVLRGRADWPRISLRYELADQSHILMRGEENLSDLNYLMRTPRHSDSEPLRYEKRMLEEWFRTRFAQHRLQRAE